MNYKTQSNHLSLIDMKQICITYARVLENEIIFWLELPKVTFYLIKMEFNAVRMTAAVHSVLDRRGASPHVV